MKILIVGSGLYGSTCAYELSQQGHKVVVVDKRNHPGGNVYTRYNEDAQCHEHVYGSHIFHTNSKEIWDYVNKFTEFVPYYHRVKAVSRDVAYSFPVNLLTIQQIFGVHDVNQARQIIQEDCVTGLDPNLNLENYCLSTIGKTLYETFFQSYSKKQWNTDPKNIPAAVARRIPIRLNFNDQYFDDRYQGMPVDGYTPIIKKMLDGVGLELNVDFLLDTDYWINRFDYVIYTGPVDEFFNCSYGRLAYRSLRFENTLESCSDFQGCSVVNYCDNSVPWTRIVEHKHFGRIKSNHSLVTKEFPQDYTDHAIPYYPVNDEKNQNLYNKYNDEVKQFSNVHFGGRLGSYRYYDMHQVIAAALKFCRDFGKDTDVFN